MRNGARPAVRLRRAAHRTCWRYGGAVESSPRNQNTQKPPLLGRLLCVWLWGRTWTYGTLPFGPSPSQKAPPEPFVAALPPPKGSNAGRRRARAGLPLRPSSAERSGAKSCPLTLSSYAIGDRLRMWPCSPIVIVGSPGTGPRIGPELSAKSSRNGRSHHLGMGWALSSEPATINFRPRL